MIKTSCATLKETGDNHDPKLARKRAEEVGGRTGDGLCQVEEVGILRLTKIRGVVEFLQHHEFCPTLGSLCNSLGKFLKIELDIGSARHLYEGYFHELINGILERSRKSQSLI